MNIIVKVNTDNNEMIIIGHLNIIYLKNVDHRI